MDDLLAKWSKQLTSTTKMFDTYTTKVKEWDQQLVSSGDEILSLYQDTIEAEGLQSRIDQNLVYVESQQDELEKLLDNYEAQADILLNNIELSGEGRMGGPGGGLTATDKLREKAYHNAELLDEKLDTLGQNLGALVNEINGVSDVFNKNSLNELGAVTKGRTSNDTIEGIVQLLNLHLENLKYVEKSEEMLREKLGKAQG